MIAFKDAFRLNISLGDKVLAPWQNDGRYGPGTVLDGYERRDTQIEGTFIVRIRAKQNYFYLFGRDIDIKSYIKVFLPQLIPNFNPQTGVINYNDNEKASRSRVSHVHWSLWARNDTPLLNCLGIDPSRSGRGCSGAEVNFESAHSRTPQEESITSFISIHTLRVINC